MVLLRYTTPIMILFFMMFAVSFSYGNIWLDEDFEDGIAFDDVDTYADPVWSPVTNPVTITGTGTVASSRAFEGIYSYGLAAGQSAYVTEPYTGQTHGAFQYYQFAASVGSIPSTPGRMATFRWSWTNAGDASLPDGKYDFKVHFDSTGSAIDVIAAVDYPTGASSAVIDTIPDTATWKLITLQMQKNPGGVAEDPAVPITGTFAQGMHFYSSSTTSGLDFLFNDAVAVDNANDWIFQVTDSSLFIDSVYWEGGLTSEVTREVEALDYDPSASVDEWKLY